MNGSDSIHGDIRGVETWIGSPHLTDLSKLLKENTNMLSTHDYVSGDQVSDEAKTYCEKVREAFKLVESVLLEHPANLSRDFSARCFALARTHLETACMYSIKGIVFDGKEVYGYGCTEGKKESCCKNEVQGSDQSDTEHSSTE